MFRTRFVLVVMAAALLGAACGDTYSDETTAAPETIESVSAPFPVTITASNGDIELAEMPTTIVSMSATHTEMLFAIGAGDQVVAVDAFSNYPGEAPITNLTGFAPNIEAIVGYGADLVVTDGDWDGTSMGALTELGIPVLILPAAQSLNDVYTQIEQLGAATGHRGEAAALVADMQSDVAEILASLPDTDAAVTFYHELDTTYYSVTSDTFVGHVYELMGLVNIADAAGDGNSAYPQLSAEFILEQDPDLILLADTICCDMSAEALAQRPGWDALTAIGRGSVVELNDDIASRWGPRVIDLMGIVADAVVTIGAES